MRNRSDWFVDWFDSPYYPILYQKRDRQEAQQFISLLGSKLGTRQGERALDLACGNGRHARYLYELGLDVYGFDLSPNRIQEAKANTSTSHFFIHDMRKGPFPVQDFHWVFNLFTSFAYFKQPQDNVKILRNIWKALLPGGGLVIDFFNAAWIVQNLVQKEKKILSGIEFHIRRYIEKGVIIKEIDVIDGGKSVRFSEQVQLLSLDDFIYLLTQNGFVIQKYWGNYQLQTFYSQKSPRLIIFATKA